MCKSSRTSSITTDYALFPENVKKAVSDYYAACQSFIRSFQPLGDLLTVEPKGRL